MNQLVCGGAAAAAAAETVAMATGSERRSKLAADAYVCCTRNNTSVRLIDGVAAALPAGRPGISVSSGSLCDDVTDDAT